MNPFNVLGLIFGGLAIALTLGMLVVGRNAIRRIRSLGREDPTTLWRLGAIRFFTASIVLLGLFISASLLLIQIGVWIGLLGPADDALGFPVFLACWAWFFNAWALDRLSRPWRREQSPREAA
jgi:hypothetical protein